MVHFRKSVFFSECKLQFTSCMFTSKYISVQREGKGEKELRPIIPQKKREGGECEGDEEETNLNGQEPFVEGGYGSMAV